MHIQHFIKTTNNIYSLDLLCKDSDCGINLIEICLNSELLRENLNDILNDNYPSLLFRWEEKIV